MDTKDNTADHFTNHLDGLLTRALAKKLGLRFIEMAGGMNVGTADGGTNEENPRSQLTAFNKRLQLSRCVSSFSFNMRDRMYLT